MLHSILYTYFKKCQSLFAIITTFPALYFNSIDNREKKWYNKTNYD